MEYLTRVRLTKAAALLRTQPATLVQIALSVGYDSEVAFSKTFKRYFGMAPGAYRQGRRKQTAKEDGSLRIADGDVKPHVQSVAYPLLRVGKEEKNQAEELQCGRVGEYLSSQLNQKEQSAP